LVIPAAFTYLDDLKGLLMRLWNRAEAENKSGKPGDGAGLEPATAAKKLP
jgi:hypothetical protein